MRIVEMFPREESTVTFLETDLQSYFQGEEKILQFSLGDKKYSFLCHQDGVQTRNSEVKALYGPVVVCSEQLQGLSEEEANLVMRYMNNNEFELSNITLH
ncbi:hypothetical protein N0O92_06595 [Alkalihalobacillus sp. MEB130]|uniref:hypothetical protein n=1 Tax=Alkalihalobacillus sp. MEB130 TaxID=2976704 RepID=UPI0028DDD276|nr:hypothetical protein [Alkalihalobacillus sp. MEB130]MDT8859896.1 hypothetical protein [Alkalihalobacillus sp. MEB130]